MVSFHPETEAARFNQKAHRVARALAACPEARAEELGPFLDVFRAREAVDRFSSVADMMCGTGYLALALLPRTRRLVLVDASAGMLDACHPHLRSGATILLTKGSFREAELPRFSPFDMVTCLAGLHHVFDTDDRHQVNRAASIALQAEVIALWASLLTDDGLILIGDVAEDAAIHAWTARARRASSSPQPSPARFFDEFVARESAIGHQAQFLSTELLQHLESLGLHCRIAVHETPWRFSSPREAAWYLGEKFAIGPDVAESASLSPAAERKILSAVEEYLGTLHEAGRGFAVGWRLAYLSVHAPTSTATTEERSGG